MELPCHLTDLLWGRPWGAQLHQQVALAPGSREVYTGTGGHVWP